MIKCEKCVNNPKTKVCDAAGTQVADRLKLHAENTGRSVYNECERVRQSAKRSERSLFVLCKYIYVYIRSYSKSIYVYKYFALAVVAVVGIRCTYYIYMHVYQMQCYVQKKKASLDAHVYFILYM